MDNLIERLENAAGPDRSLDADLYLLDFFPVDKCLMDQVRASAPAYTSSIDAAITLIPKGWIWKVCTCCISDDAWCVPDYNSPIHGDRLRREIGPAVKGDITDEGIDVELRPSGRPAIAICIAALEARKFCQKAMTNSALKTRENV